MPPALARAAKMAKKDSEPREGAKRTTTTRIEVELLRMAKTVAAYRDIDLAAYLDEVIRQRVQQDYDAIIRKGG